MKKSLSGIELGKILETVNERDLFLVGHMYMIEMSGALQTPA